MRRHQRTGAPVDSQSEREPESIARLMEETEIFFMFFKDFPSNSGEMLPPEVPYVATDDDLPDTFFQNNQRRKSN